MRLPYFNKYPYTNFEQLNIDWLLSTVSGFDARIKKNEEDINTLDGRVDTLEGRVDNHDIDIDDLKRRMSTAEDDIDHLEDRMTTAEGTISDHVLDISDLKDRMTTAEGDIGDIKGDILTINGNIITINTTLDDIKDMISREYDETTTYLKGYYCYFTAHGISTFYVANKTTTGSFKLADWDRTDISVELQKLAVRQTYFADYMELLEDRVDNIPVVEANPGGSGTALNTITIDNITYVIPSGGGGGGSSVTPNPLTPATDELNTVDIDGTVYSIPANVEGNGASAVTEGALTKLCIGSDVYSVQNLTVDNSLDDTSSNPISNSAVATALDNIASDYSEVTEADTTISASGNALLHSETLVSGVWLLMASCNLNVDSGSLVCGSSNVQIFKIGSPAVQLGVNTNVINNTGITHTVGYGFSVVGIAELTESTEIQMRMINNIQQSGYYSVSNIKFKKIRLK